jgi:DNA polymerase-3 subunit epsilon
MRFVAVDVETANADVASICQIGAAVFDDADVVDRWSTLIDPEDEFSGLNVQIHGITPDRVCGAPTFPAVAHQLRELLHGQIVACHTSFDRLSIGRACERYGLPPVECRWLDTARVVRRAWPQYRQSGFGLKSVAEDMGIKFRHHDAAEDARAAGEILVRAVAETDVSVADWLLLALRPCPSPGPLAGNPEGPLLGETAVFTGSLTLPRRLAAELAAKAGCNVGTSVNRATTLLIVGDQDLRKLAGRERSNKQIKAEELIAGGQAIRVLGEGDFLRLIEQAGIPRD